LPTPRISGVPEDLEFEILDDICLRELGDRLSRVSFTQLSGLRQSGVFRLHLQTSTGRPWSLIFKNAIFNLEGIPALQGLPLAPGPPEFHVYSNPGEALPRFLPDVYYLAEIEPGKHFQYLLEDLTTEYRRAPTPQDTLRAAAALPALQDAMKGWQEGGSAEQWIEYDKDLCLKLLAFSRKHLERYLQVCGDPVVESSICLLSGIAEVFLAEDPFAEFELGPVHGDFNKANILIHRIDPGRVKVLDWEWAGRGIPHADAASLLKRALPEIENLSLAEYVRADGQHPVLLHLRTYEWCQLSRGLLDAAFLAVHVMDAPEKTDWHEEYVKTALHRVCRAYHALTRDYPRPRV